MPLYEYRCESCDHQFEVIQKFSDPHVSVCPKCGSGPVVKLISSPAFTFKGTGFYITDYARKDQNKSDGSGDKSEKSEKAEKSDKAADSKPASTDAKAAPSTTTTTKAD
jgi:putative FmdB family regulatory protein